MLVTPSGFHSLFPSLASSAATPAAPETKSKEFCPEILSQDLLRARWMRKSLINRQGQCTAAVPKDLPPFQAALKRSIANWLAENDIAIESSKEELFWEGVVNLEQAIAFAVESAPFPIEDISLIGSQVPNLIRKHAAQGMCAFGFLLEGEEIEEMKNGDKDIRLGMPQAATKGDLRKCLKKQTAFLAKGLPDRLRGADAAKAVRETWPDKYQTDLPLIDVPVHVIGNTSFLKNFVKQDEEQLYFIAAFGNKKSPPTEFIIYSKMKNFSLFCLDDMQIQIRSMFKPFCTVDDICLKSLKGSTQAMADLIAKRARFTHLAKCDARAYFRYFIAQIKNILIDEPEDVEKTLFNQVKNLTEDQAALHIFSSVKNHLPDEGLSYLLLMCNSLAAAEKMGSQWNFAAIASRVHELAELSRESLPPAGQAIYDAIYKEKIPFSQIIGALQTAAFFHLFTKAGSAGAFLTESSFKPAMQWKFGASHTFVVPLKAPTAISTLEALLPAAYCEEKEAQVFPYLDCLDLPPLFDLSRSLENPLLAFHCQLLVPKIDLPRLLNLFIAAGGRENERLIALLENYLASRNIFPRWDLRNGEEWELTLAKSGLVEMSQMAFDKWKNKPDILLGLKLFDECINVDFGLALRIRRELMAHVDFTPEHAQNSFAALCTAAKSKNIKFHRMELLNQAVMMAKVAEPTPQLIELLSLEQEEGSDLFFALLERGCAVPKEYAPICLREFQKAVQKEDTLRAVLIADLAEKIDWNEEWVLTLAKSGQLEFCERAFAKWKKKPDLTSGIKLFDAFLKVDTGLALRLRAELTRFDGFTSDIAWRTFLDACAMGRRRDWQRYRNPLIEQAIPVARSLQKGEKINKTFLDLLTLELEEGSALYFTLLEEGVSIPKEYHSICQREFIQSHEGGEKERAAQILKVAEKQKIKLQTPQDCALLEQSILNGTNDAVVLNKVRELAALQKLSPGIRSVLKKMAAKKKQVVFDLVRSGITNLLSEAFYLWKEFFRTDLVLAEEIYTALPCGEEEALIDLSLVLLTGKKIPDDMIYLLHNEARKAELLRAMLRSSCAIEKAPLRKALHEVAKDSDIELWQEAKARRQITPYLYFLEMKEPRSPFFRKIVTLLTPTEATQGVNLLIQTGEVGDLLSILKDLSTTGLKEYPQELSTLLERDGVLERILHLPCPLPSSLAAPLSRHIAAIEIDSACTLYDLGVKKGLKVVCKAVLYKKTEEALANKNAAALVPLLVELRDLDLIQQAKQAGLLEKIGPLELIEFLKAALSQKGCFSLTLFFLKKVKRDHLKDEEALKRDIQAFCKEQVEAQPNLEDKRELILCLQTLGIPFNPPVSEQWLPLLTAYPDMKDLLIPFLPLCHAYPYLPLGERTRHLKENKDFAPFAPQVAKELIQESKYEEALALLIQYSVEESSLWQSALAKHAENAPAACWKMAQEQVSHLGDDDSIHQLKKQILTLLAKEKDPLIITLLKDKASLEKELPEKILIQILPALFLALPDQEDLVGIKALWQAYFSNIDPLALLCVDLKIHILLSKNKRLDLKGEIANLEKFCSSFTKAELAPFKETMTLALTLLFKKSQNAAFEEIDEASSTLYSLCQQIFMHGFFGLDPFLPIQTLLSIHDPKFFEICILFLTKGLEKGGEIQKTAKANCTVVFFNTLTCGEIHLLLQLFHLLNNPKASQLFEKRSDYETFCMELITHIIEKMNQTSLFEANFIRQLILNMKTLVELHPNGAFDKMIERMDEMFINLLFFTKAEEELALKLNSEYRTYIIKSYSKSKHSEMAIGFKVASRQLRLLQNLTGAYGRAKDKIEVRNRLMRLTTDNLDPGISSLLNNFPDNAEKVLHRFAMACIETQEKKWIEDAAAILKKVSFCERFKNKDLASQIIVAYQSFMTKKK